MANTWVIRLLIYLAVSRVEDILSDIYFELQPNAKFKNFISYRAVLEVGRGVRVGMSKMDALAFRSQFSMSPIGGS